MLEQKASSLCIHSSTTSGRTWGTAPHIMYNTLTFTFAYVVSKHEQDNEDHCFQGQI